MNKPPQDIIAIAIINDLLDIVKRQSLQNTPEFHEGVKFLELIGQPYDSTRTSALTLDYFTKKA